MVHIQSKVSIMEIVWLNVKEMENCGCIERLNVMIRYSKNTFFISLTKNYCSDFCANLP